jgi:hypothetical protein
MEMSLNRIELVSNKNIMAEKKAVELTLIVNKAKKINTLFVCEDMCDGDIWEWNHNYGIGNDVY